MATMTRLTEAGKNTLSSQMSEDQGCMGQQEKERGGRREEGLVLTSLPSISPS